MTLSRALVVLACASGALTLLPAPAEAAPAVKIVKIYYNSPGSDDRSNSSLNAEYVVLKNVTTSSRSISGWKVKDVAGHTYTFGSLSIPAGKTVTLHTGKGSNSSTHRYWGSGAYIWNNDKDTAYLRNGAGTLVHSCTYSSSSSAYKTC